MKGNHKENTGLRQLYETCQKAFRIPENLNYYSVEDFKAAERRFIKHAMLCGCVDLFGLAHPKPQ